MEKISFYLERYSNIGLKEKKIKNLLIESIKELCDINLLEEEIKISNNIIKINVSGVIKTEIFIKRENIKDLFYKKIEENSYKISDKKIL